MLFCPFPATAEEGGLQLGARLIHGGVREPIWLHMESMSFNTDIISDYADSLISIFTDPCLIPNLFQNSGLKENAITY